ncbi:MAG: methylornithine synthase PylB [Actinobacteria bacterium]|nr:methylornithine synthase PylB [Actinomycetota bacterium]
MPTQSSPDLSVAAICERALDGARPSAPELETLLSVSSEEEAEPVFAAARELRKRHFGAAIFLSGFVYYTTYCRNHCNFCLYRKGNDAAPRYRKSLDEILTLCRGLTGEGINLIDLTSGEDPLTHDTGDYQSYYDMIAAVRRETGKPIMISPGVVPADVLVKMQQAGATIFACYQETHTRDLYKKLRVQQDFDERCAARANARRAGMLVEDGILTGVGDTVADRVNSILEMSGNDWELARSMTFVPQEGTPLAGLPIQSPLHELLVTAALRLMKPGWMTTASLDCESLAGLKARLDAGASVVTSIIYPETGFCGVANAELDVDEGLRTVPAVLGVLAGMGLRQGSDEEYAAWIDGSRVARAVPVA